jgi:hypothetical protein
MGIVAAILNVLVFATVKDLLIATLHIKIILLIIIKGEVLIIIPSFPSQPMRSRMRKMSKKMHGMEKEL